MCIRDSFKKIWDLAGTEQKNIRNSILRGFVNAVFHAMQLWALFVVLDVYKRQVKH